VVYLQEEEEVVVPHAAHQRNIFGDAHFTNNGRSIAVHSNGLTIKSEEV
jgi:hypothetical protein